MPNGSSERRRAPRFAIPAPATVRNGSGRQVAGNIVNVSSSGVLLDLSESMDLENGDEVLVHVDLPQDPEIPLPAWGLATVARVDGARIAVELFMAGFHPLQEEPPFPEQR